MNRYKLFCADCHQSYAQLSDKPPRVCGACGSDYVAVKQIPLPHQLREDMNITYEHKTYGLDMVPEVPNEDKV